MEVKLVFGLRIYVKRACVCVCVCVCACASVVCL